jgi:hypothetical protein
MKELTEAETKINKTMKIPHYKRNKTKTSHWTRRVVSWLTLKNNKTNRMSDWFPCCCIFLLFRNKRIFKDSTIKEYSLNTLILHRG